MKKKIWAPSSSSSPFSFVPGRSGWPRPAAACPRRHRPRARMKAAARISGTSSPQRRQHGVEHQLVADPRVPPVPQLRPPLLQGRQPLSTQLRHAHDFLRRHRVVLRAGGGEASSGPWRSSPRHTPPPGQSGPPTDALDCQLWCPIDTSCIRRDSCSCLHQAFRRLSRLRRAAPTPSPSTAMAVDNIDSTQNGHQKSNAHPG